LREFDFEDRGYAVCSDALMALRDPEGAGFKAERYDLITITPPYEEVVYEDIMDAVRCSPLVGQDTVIVVEVRQSEERSEELATTSLVTKTARPRTSVQHTPLP